jgi:anti-anti-sigma factor
MTLRCAGGGKRPRLGNSCTPLAPTRRTLPGDPVPLFDVALVPTPDQVVVRLTGDADLSTAPLVADALARAAALGTRHVVVDVAAAHFWDSSTLRTLATVSAQLASAGRACRVVGAGPATRRLIGAADLGDRLELDGPIVERAVPEPAARGSARAVHRPVEISPVAPRRPSRGHVGALPLRRWS